MKVVFFVESDGGEYGRKRGPQAQTNRSKDDESTTKNYRSKYSVHYLLQE